MVLLNVCEVEIVYFILVQKYRENLSYELKSAIGKRKPSNIQEVEQFAKAEWEKIPSERCKKLIGGYQERLEAASTAKGCATKLLLHMLFFCFFIKMTICKFKKKYFGTKIPRLHKFPFCPFILDILEFVQKNKGVPVMMSIHTKIDNSPHTFFWHLEFSGIRSPSPQCLVFHGGPVPQLQLPTFSFTVACGCRTCLEQWTWSGLIHHSPVFGSSQGPSGGLRILCSTLLHFLVPHDHQLICGSVHDRAEGREARTRRKDKETLPNIGALQTSI